MQWICFALILCNSGLLLANTEVRRIPDQDIVYIKNDETKILKFRLLGNNLNDFLIQYKVDNSLGLHPNNSNMLNTNPINPSFASGLFNICAELKPNETRQCKELQILVRGRPDIHGTIFRPSFVDLSPFPPVPVVTDLLYHIQYQDGTTSVESSTSDVTNKDTTTGEYKSTEPHTTKEEKEMTTEDKSVNTAKPFQKEISQTDYVMFAALITLAIVVAISLFINIILCFKLRSQRLQILEKNIQIAGTVESV